MERKKDFGHCWNFIWKRKDLRFVSLLTTNDCFSGRRERPFVDISLWSHLFVWLWNQFNETSFKVSSNDVCHSRIGTECIKCLVKLTLYVDSAQNPISGNDIIGPKRCSIQIWSNVTPKQATRYLFQGVPSTVTFVHWHALLVLGLNQYLFMTHVPHKMLQTSKLVKNNEKLTWRSQTFDRHSTLSILNWSQYLVTTFNFTLKAE